MTSIYETKTYSAFTAGMEFERLIRIGYIEFEDVTAKVNEMNDTCKWLEETVFTGPWFNDNFYKWENVENMTAYRLVQRYGTEKGKKFWRPFISVSSERMWSPENEAKLNQEIDEMVESFEEEREAERMNELDPVF